MPEYTMPPWAQIPDGVETVPDILTNTTDIVTDILELAVTRSGEAITAALESISALQISQVPGVLPEPPSDPSVTASYSAAIGFAPLQTPNIGVITPQDPGAYVPTTVTVPDGSDIRDYVPLISGLTVPEPPVVSNPIEPLAPTVDTSYTIPDEPVAEYGTAPELFDLDLPTFDHPILPIYGLTAPTFTDAAPDPFIQWQEPEYSSTVRDAVQSVILTMLAGGTGLPAAIEQAIWERGRGREDAASLKLVAEATAAWASRGHELPTGALNAQLYAIYDDVRRKANELSREIMVNQADLEQKNRQFAVTSGISYEQIFVNLFLQIVDRNFQIAKFGVETQIQIFNSKVLAFNARVTGFSAEIQGWRAQLDAEMAKIKIYEAEIEAERLKGEVNKLRLDRYNAMIQAYVAQVGAFKALVEASTAKVQLEKNKVDVYRAEVDGYVGKLNGNRAIYEAYGERVKGETAKASLEEANARAYAAYVQGQTAKNELAIKNADIGIQNNRMLLEYAVANMNRLTQFTQQQVSAIQAEAQVFDSETRRATAEFESERSAQSVNLQAQVEASRILVGRYQASLEKWKANVQHILSAANINSDAIKAAGQIAATLAAGAMAATHVSAGLTGSASMTQGKSVQAGWSLTDAHSFNENNTWNAGNTTSTSHNYYHQP